eukprot:2731462-Karenia_brevis.AAC.1
MLRGRQVMLVRSSYQAVIALSLLWYRADGTTHAQHAARHGPAAISYTCCLQGRQCHYKHCRPQ